MTKRNWANYESDAVGHKALILADETDLTIFIKLITNSEKKKKSWLYLAGNHGRG